MAGFDVSFRHEAAFADTADAWSTCSASCANSPAQEATGSAVADSWSSPLLAGDPYRESEVFRSVEFGGYSHEEHDFAGGDFMLASDPYSLCDASRSAIPSGLEADFGSLPGDWHDFSMLKKGGDELGFGQAEFGIPSGEKFNNFNFAEFTQGTVAPEVPKDEYFKFLPTTTYIISSDISHVGNTLVRFLSDRFSCSDLKVKPEKYTIKAHLAEKASPYLADAGECTVKLRIYSLGGGNHAIEFQRRRGDIVFFREVFRMLSRYLDQNLLNEH